MSRHTRRLFSLSKEDRNLVGYLLTPSALSGFIGVVASLGVVIGGNIALHYNGSGLQQLLNSHMAANNTSLATTSTSLGSNFSSNIIVSDIPLFIFWAGVGLIVYSFAVNVVKIIGNIAGLHEELNYVNADRHELIMASLEHLVLRSFFLGVWLFYMRYSAHILLPYAIAIAQVGNKLGGIVHVASYGGLAVLLLAIFIHLHTVLLRSVLLKPRAFWRSAYD